MTPQGHAFGAESDGRCRSSERGRHGTSDSASLGVGLRLRAALLVTLFSLGLAACSGIRVETDYNPETDFAALKRYAWLPNVAQGKDPQVSVDPRVHNSLVDARVRSAVDRELAARGFEKTASSAAEFLVTYYVNLESKLDVQTLQRSYGYGYRSWGGGFGSETTMTQYDEGTLLIDFVDARGKALLWRGAGSARLSGSSSPEKREARVNRAVQEILKRFPPS
jgi:hypothetical protein